DVCSSDLGQPGQRLVDRVVHHLVDHVVKTGAVVGVPDVHPGTFTHGLEALEDLDALFVVVAGGRFGGSGALATFSPARWDDRSGHWSRPGLAVGIGRMAIN